MPAKKIHKYLTTTFEIDDYEYYNLEEFSEIMLGLIDQYQGKNVVFKFESGDENGGFSVRLYEERMETEEEVKHREAQEEARKQQNIAWKKRQLEMLKKELGVE